MSDFNNLSNYDIMRFKTEGCGNNEPSRKNITIVAEGDSWFDYPPGIDIPDYLSGYYNYNVIKLGKYGDRLLNMIYGIDNNSKKNNLEFIKKIIVEKKSNILIFSGGGNDIAGDQLEIFLNYYNDKLKPDDIVKKNILDDFFNDLKKTIIFMIDEVLKVNTKIKIIMHGYGYAIPDGRPTYYAFGTLPIFGPWLKPALSHRGINDINTGKDIIKIIIDSYNNMLSGISSDYSNVFYNIDLRCVIKKNDWVNELHVNNEMFKKIAGLFHEKIQSII